MQRVITLEMILQARNIREILASDRIINMVTLKSGPRVKGWLVTVATKPQVDQLFESKHTGMLHTRTAAFGEETPLEKNEIVLSSEIYEFDEVTHYLIGPASLYDTYSPQTIWGS